MKRDRCGTMANNLLCPCYRLEKMISFASCLLDTIAACLAVPIAVFVIEICAASFLARRHPAPPTARRRGTVAVLIPAHDEAKGILATLNDIRPQIRPTDRLLVVADNCTDDTAAIAASGGAEGHREVRSIKNRQRLRAGLGNKLSRIKPTRHRPL